MIYEAHLEERTAFTGGKKKKVGGHKEDRQIKI